MFEEAELSGVLMLAHRKLKEFPNHLAVKYDITDVISADLSDNRLNELPICICEMTSMETLRSRGTGFRSLPPAIQLLESLYYLDLSDNQLSSLPVGLFSIHHLQVLLLTGNRLESLPREIRQLAGSLHELDVSCNRLRAIPADIAMLKQLRVLNVRDNRLTRLPSELSRMELRVLDVSENEISDLPPELPRMRSLIDLQCHSNPLTSPPAVICAKGREHAFKWLQARSQACEALRPLDWSVNRTVAINATLRRGRYPENGIDSVARRADRRSRSTRFNTLGGTDSGYASTVDEHRYSHEYQTPTSSAAGCLFGINECLRSPKSPPGQDSSPAYESKAKCCEVVEQQQQTTTSSIPTGSNATGLLSEVMSAYADKLKVDCPHSESPVTSSTSTCYRTSMERSLLFSGSTIMPISSSSSSLLSSSTVTHRPQAIVSPMTAVTPSSLEQARTTSDIPKSSFIERCEVTKSELDARCEVTKSELDSSRATVPTNQLLRSSRSLDEVKDVSNNNNNNDTVSSVLNSTDIDAETDTDTKKGSNPKSEMNGSNPKSGNIPRDRTLNLHIADSRGLTLKLSETERAMIRQKTPIRGKSQDVDQPKVLSPVLEAPPTSMTANMNGNADECIASDLNTSIAVRSSLVPEGSCSTVRPVNTTATVSSAIKLSTSLSPRVSAGSSRSSSSLNSSRSSVASSRSVPPLKRPPPAGHTTISRTTTTATSHTTTTTTTKTSKLSKTRDSIGLARNHLNGSSATRKPMMSSLIERSRGLNANENGHQTTSISHPATLAHTTTGVVENMRKIFEQRINMSLPRERDQLAASLADGIALCNLANSIRPRVVPMVLTAPTMSSSPLSPPKCRRNVENFLSACRRMGVPEMSLSLCTDIVDRRNLPQTARTVLALSKMAASSSSSSSNSNSSSTVRMADTRRVTNV